MPEFKFAFKIAAGAYLGWHVMSALDDLVGRIIAPHVRRWTDKDDD